MLPDLWTAPTDAPTTRSLEIAPRFPQHPQPIPSDLQTDLNETENLQILCPPPAVAGFETFGLSGRVWTFGDTPRGSSQPLPLSGTCRYASKPEGSRFVPACGAGLPGPWWLIGAQMVRLGRATELELL